MKQIARLQIIALLATVLVACGGATTTSPATQGGAAPATGGTIKLILGAYTTPREAYRKIIPLFQTKWQQEHGQTVEFEESYQGSGAQSRAVVEGFEADVVALSLEADVTRLVTAKLITHDWQSGPSKGIVSDSLVAFAVRPGNPKGIKDWADLAKPGVNILTPNPKTSGGAQWNIMALYGAAFRGQVDGVAKGDDAAAQAFLKAVLKNVTVLDKGARESITNFEKGVGDVAITYENEVLVGKQGGQKYDLVLPRSTILIENPVAVVDTYTDKHGTRAAAEAFVAFLYTPEVQKIFAEYGLRSVDQAVSAATAAQYPPVQDQWTIQEFGGWKAVTPKFFGDDGIYSKLIAEVQK